MMTNIFRYKIYFSQYFHVYRNIYYNCKYIVDTAKHILYCTNYHFKTLLQYDQNMLKSHPTQIKNKQPIRHTD